AARSARRALHVAARTAVAAARGAAARARRAGALGNARRPAAARDHDAQDEDHAKKELSHPFSVASAASRVTKTSRLAARAHASVLRAQPTTALGAAAARRPLGEA